MMSVPLQVGKLSRITVFDNRKVTFMLIDNSNNTIVESDQLDQNLKVLVNGWHRNGSRAGDCRLKAFLVPSRSEAERLRSEKSAGTWRSLSVVP